MRALTPGIACMISLLEKAAPAWAGPPVRTLEGDPNFQAPASDATAWLVWGVVGIGTFAVLAAVAGLVWLLLRRSARVEPQEVLAMVFREGRLDRASIPALRGLSRATGTPEIGYLFNAALLASDASRHAGTVGAKNASKLTRLADCVSRPGPNRDGAPGVN